MSETVIWVEGLGKKYLIGHQQPQQRYVALRDVIAHGAKSWGRQFLAPFSQQKEDATQEEFWALKDVSFEVKQGDRLGVIGRNGAGKSTLLKILSRITEPTQGRISIKGRVASLLEVGTGFHPELTGRENIYLNGAILGMSKVEIQSKFDEIVAFAEVEKFLDTPVKRYSSGMYVRLAFAVAAHLEPEILVVDEVLAVGDAQFQKKCLGKMEDVSAKEGRTVLFVSHNMSALTRLCSKAILLEKGSLVKTGVATDVVATYLENVAESSGTRNWSMEMAPGNEKVKVVSVTLTNKDGTPISVASVEEQLQLKIGYYVGLPQQKFRCGVMLFTQGVTAFSAMEPVEMERTQVGLYVSTVTIPPNLLAEGEYSVQVSIFASKGAKERYAVVRDVIAFQMIDPITGESARGDYAENMLGVVMPRLQWQLSFQTEECENYVF